jgi:cellulose synthase/poly-beta-1,6-N-acetylglucosamine synthase-like glycosyltransferase
MNLAIIKWKDILSAKDTENTFLVFYDADSRPHKNTFYYFAAIYSQNPKCNIFQQSSFFDIPIRLSGLSSKSNLQNIFCRASSLRANRFVLAYEIPRILNRLSLYKKRKSYGSILGFFTFAHCVGHGLFIRSSFAQQVLFPENSILEDMFYGFIVNYLREPVIPIPIMNNSEVPNDFENLFFQMSRWFLGPSRFIKYYNYAKNRYKEYSRYYLGNFSLVMSCLIITLAWLLTSPFFLVLFSTLIFLPVLSLNGIINHGNYIIQSLIIISLLLYFFSILLMILYHPRLCHLAGTSKIGNRINVMQAIQLLMIYPAILIFHSFPAYHSIINLFFAKGKSFTKKTERQ